MYGINVGLHLGICATKILVRKADGMPFCTATALYCTNSDMEIIKVFLHSIVKKM
jgi:hypothetical protein